MRRLATGLASAMLAVAIVVSAAGTGRGALANPVADPGFESGGLATWHQCGTVDARITTVQVHRGKYAMRAGSTSRTSGEVDGDSGLCQSVTIPTNGVLSFWVYGVTNETSTEFSYQEAELLDSEGNTVTMLWQASVDTKGWAPKTVDVSAYAGKTLSLYFGVHGNGYAKKYTTLYVDDVSLRGGGAVPSAAPASGAPATVAPGPTPAPPAQTGGPTPIPGPSGGSGTSCGNHCGTERWHVKTLSDPFAAQVNRNVKITSVHELIGAPVPTGMSAKADNVRFAPWELQAVQLRATFVGWKTESDNDFHIVIADMANPKQTMIIEPPSSACSSACSSGYGALFQAARDAFVACLGPAPAQFTYPKKTVVMDVTGVPLFDVLHGQTGVAPNGIELHPLLSVSFVSGC